MRKKMWRVMAFVMAFAMVTATGCSKNDNSAEESSDLNVKVTDEKVKVATPTNYELVATATTKLSTTETSETTETTMTEVTFTSEEVGVPYNPSSGSGGGGNSSGSGSSRSEVAEATETPLESSVVELPLQLSTDNFETDTYGNSILISWDADASRSYEIYLSGMSNTVYDSYFDFSFGLGTCVISGLESGISYTVRVTPLLSDEEKEAGCESTTQIFPAENIVVLDKPTASKEYKVEQRLSGRTIRTSVLHWICAKKEMRHVCLISIHTWQQRKIRMQSGCVAKMQQLISGTWKLWISLLEQRYMLKQNIMTQQKKTGYAMICLFIKSEQE